MADQTIRIENMPDSGSKEAIAYALWRALRDAKETRDDQLRFYVKCLSATQGYAPE